MLGLLRVRHLPSLVAAALAWSVGAAAAASPRTDLVIGMAIEPSGLDPTIAAPVAIGQVTWQNVFEGLVRIDRNGAIQPQLAAAWTIAPDGLTYTFDLRTGVKFHNGEPFDAAVAKYSLDRARGPQSVNSQKAFYDAIDAIDTPDAKTLVLRLKQPAGNLLYWLGWPAAVMVEPKSAASDRTDPVGTGPFRFSSWKRGDRVDLIRNPEYWDTARAPRLERAVFRFIPDPQAQSAALRAGDVDAFPEFGTPELFNGFESDKGFSAMVGKTGLKAVAGMNNARKPFDDKRVRQALMLAVDRKMLIEGAYSGLGTPIGSHFSPTDPGYKDMTGVLPYDLGKAKALLAEAGYPNGFSFTMKTPQMSYASRSSEVLQALLSEIGVKMTIETSEFPAQWIQDVFLGRNFDMTIVAHAEPLDIGIYARDPYYFNYKNPAFDTVIAAAEREVDPAKRAVEYGQAQAILAEDVPALYLFVLPKLGVWNRKVEGLWVDEPIPSNDLTEVHWAD